MNIVGEDTIRKMEGGIVRQELTGLDHYSDWRLYRHGICPNHPRDIKLLAVRDTEYAYGLVVNESHA
jgi:hypothetical protein